MKYVRHIGAALVAVTLFSLPCFAAATITIVNFDGAGEGFNDPTPVAPVGGNSGTTLGQQRLIAFQAAANIWGATLTSVPSILVRAQFNALTCTGSGVVLGSAGTTVVFLDPNGTNLSPANTWFHAALANKLTGTDNHPPSGGDGGEEISATFNSNMGGGGTGVTPGCGFTYYMGVDQNPPPGQTPLIYVVLHELAHALGFSTTTNGTTGVRLSEFNHKFDTFLLGLGTNLTWPAMTNAQRAASAISPRQLVWTGANATAAVPTVLSAGFPEMIVNAPASLAGSYLASAFQGATTAYPNLTYPGVTADVMPAMDLVAPNTDACTSISPASAAGLAGKIALVDRGTCTFNVKLANVTAAGAVGMILVDDLPGSPPSMVGPDMVPAIPTVLITQANGAVLRNFLRFRSRTSSGLRVTIRLSNGTYSGADALGRPLLFTPNPFQGGASVAHLDPIAFPHMLMRPTFPANPRPLSVIPPHDLTFRFLQDMGW